MQRGIHPVTSVSKRQRKRSFQDPSFLRRFYSRIQYISLLSLAYSLLGVSSPFSASFEPQPSQIRPLSSFILIITEFSIPAHRVLQDDASANDNVMGVHEVLLAALHKTLQLRLRAHGELNAIRS